MAEGTYEYECMRAELLGLEKPDYDEFMKNKVEQEAAAAADEEIDTQNLEDTVLRNENLSHLHGGLDELNSILQSTQKKITRFRQSCGSLTSILKFRLGSQSGSTESMVTPQQQEGNSSEEPQAQNSETPDEDDDDETIRVHGPPPQENGTETSQRKSDLTKALDKHVDVLDSLGDKMENAQYSMSYQNKQMRKFL